METGTKRVSSSVAGFIKTEIHAGEAEENNWLINKVTKAYQIFTCEQVFDWCVCPVKLFGSNSLV